MGRPRKFGPTITFRLPVDLHALADEKAQAKGLTVNEYLCARITEALTRQGARDQQAAAPASAPASQSARDRHVDPVWKASMKP